MNIDNTHFDRLVDDELSDEERRELLTRLEDEPGGWRRCALAFLEAQCWKDSFRLRRSEPAEQRNDTGTVVPLKPAQRSPWTGRVGLISAMAASFLVAMLIGSAAHRIWVGQADLPGMPSQVAKKTDDARPSLDQPQNALVAANPQNTVASDPRHTVAVSSHPLVNMPAVERDRVDDRWLRSLPSAVPDNVMQALTRTGHQVQQQRELVPVALKDGRQMVVPVDHVDIHYTGNGTY